MKLPRELFFILLLAVFLSGCSSSSSNWSGPSEPAPISAKPWTYQGRKAQTVSTPHYNLNTTMENTQFLDTTAQVMEGAFQQYQKLVPGLVVSQRPMECFVFANRNQWDDFTRRHTGDNAKLYLQIKRGGYAIGDWYVSYYLGDYSTYSVAAHEGWHQFAGRNFKGHLPPFLEEGIACLFEGLSLAGPHGLPQWNFAINLNRAIKLHEAVSERRTYPLEQLITLHAGLVIGEGPDKVDSFYAQDWAFARFLWDGDNGAHRAGLQRLLADTAAGDVYDPLAGRNHPAMFVRPDAIKGILEHYLDMPFSQIEKSYAAYVGKIAFEQFNAQWQS